MFQRPSGRLALLACFVLGVVATFVFSGGRSSPPAPRVQDEANPPPLDKDAAARLGGRMDADASLASLLATCPADAWRCRGDLTRSAKVTAAACARTPDSCLADCLEFASGHACTALAFVVQKTKDIDKLYAEKLFQLACAAGDSGGCVNRAAGIRNADYAGDPFRTRPAGERHACEFRSFAIACDLDGVWGCAMRGQAYAEGEGVAADAAAARRDYAKARALDPKFPACRFARARLGEMKAAETAAPAKPR